MEHASLLLYTRRIPGIYDTGTRYDATATAQVSYVRTPAVQQLSHTAVPDTSYQTAFGTGTAVQVVYL